MSAAPGWLARPGERGTPSLHRHPRRRAGLDEIKSPSRGPEAANPRFNPAIAAQNHAGARLVRKRLRTAYRRPHDWQFDEGVIMRAGRHAIIQCMTIIPARLS